MIRKDLDEFLNRFQEYLKRGKDRDEDYVIDLCDEVLNEKALRQYGFDFLRGDSGKDGKPGRKLPVDAYYKSKNLVVEYNERQHTESVALFDKKKTISGVSRGEQRKIYDKRRAEVLPQHGIRFIVISYDDFEYDGKKKIKRKREHDLEVIRKKLTDYLNA